MCHIFTHVKPIFVTGLKGTSMGKTKKAGKTADAAPEKMGLLQAMEQVVKLSSRSELEDKFFAEAGSYIDIVSKKLDMTPGQRYRQQKTGHDTGAGADVLHIHRPER